MMTVQEAAYCVVHHWIRRILPADVQFEMQNELELVGNDDEIHDGKKRRFLFPILYRQTGESLRQDYNPHKVYPVWVVWVNEKSNSIISLTRDDIELLLEVNNFDVETVWPLIYDIPVVEYQRYGSWCHQWDEPQYVPEIIDELVRVNRADQ